MIPVPEPFLQIVLAYLLNAPVLLPETWNIRDEDKLLVDGMFRLRHNLKVMPAHIGGQLAIHLWHIVRN